MKGGADLPQAQWGRQQCNPPPPSITHKHNIKRAKRVRVLWNVSGRKALSRCTLSTPKKADLHTFISNFF